MKEFKFEAETLGQVSDGYHTFDELYHHRAVLFATICNQNKTIAWKSKLHADGTMYDNYFVVGIKTPEGDYSYHYDIDGYWDLFDVQELEHAPEFDGHQPKDVGRLLSIGNRDDSAEEVQDVSEMYKTLVEKLEEFYNSEPIGNTGSVTREDFEKEYEQLTQLSPPNFKSGDIDAITTENYLTMAHENYVPLKVNSAAFALARSLVWINKQYNSELN